MKLFRIFLLMFLLFGFASCGDDANASSDDDTDLTSEMEAKYQQADLYSENVSSELVAANTRLASKLFSEVNGEGQNIMISPLSISIAMAMVLNGAGGENFDEMKTVLEYDSMTMEDINKSFYNLINSLIEADKDMSLFIADSVWMYDALGEFFYEDYTNLLEQKYKAEPYVIDFFSDTALGEINGWVSEKTNGKINKIIDEISPNAVMFLINAIYFNATWTTEFNESRTSAQKFTKSDGKEVDAQMMRYSRSQTFRYYSSGKEKGDYTVVRLPYGRGAFAFYGILPNKEGDINDVVLDLKENGVEKYFNNLSEKEVSVLLPKFKLEYSNKMLVGNFMSLGMEKAFIQDESDGGFEKIADFGKMLYITKITHKTLIDVNEVGTEAVAATVVEVGDTGSEPEDQYTFHADHPFLYFIRDDRSGTILFMGKVEDPTVEKQEKSNKNSKKLSLKI